MSYEECAKHRGADATNGCQWCVREKRLNCAHHTTKCADCGAAGLCILTGLIPIGALELGLQWLTTPEYKR
jgi:hypothetical protein